MPDSKDHYRTDARCLDEAGTAICFACCLRTKSPPFWFLGDDRPPKHLEEDIMRINASKGTGPCSWLGDDGRCKHYDDRPKICKEFEVGGADCVTLRTMDGKQPPSERP